ncbi:MAG: hypothetical protein HRF50_02985 [Phycisphaerae bacterium]|jgi:hypothetical protein
MRRMIASFFVALGVGVTPVLACTYVGVGITTGVGPCAGCVNMSNPDPTCGCDGITCMGGEWKVCIIEARSWSGGPGCAIYQCEEYCADASRCRLGNSTSKSPCTLDGQCALFDKEEGWDIYYYAICD